MPLVRVDALGMERDRLEHLGDAVHEALVETIGIPADDRFHVLTSHDGQSSTLRHDTYLDIPRDDGIVIVDITMRAGRSDEQKSALYRRLCQLAGERAQVEPHNVFVVIHENSPSDWSLGYGEAQYQT